ncbi:hypothetical protein EZH22_22010 [Xanthobacter dioxanivorans]|uniref:Uncharacterized protein n=1 Tax=Xanthobacter dioxanivorans TaxID=2528964 RepID=A0A974PLD1_9HYPH|nr:hypothetical protein [Xanthobacter dioxanivorans]QRG05697.1 hypothetical protein EZH22_22010 [Xanthobacter dioxanivorans]
MADLFYILAGVALFAALGAWAMAVRGGRAALAANAAAGRGGGPGSYALLVLWPFAVKRLGSDADADAVRTGKASIAFFVSLTIAIASISAYTNLTFKRDHAAPAGPAPAAPANAPTKS